MTKSKNKKAINLIWEKLDSYAQDSLGGRIGLEPGKNTMMNVLLSGGKFAKQWGILQQL